MKHPHRWKGFTTILAAGVLVLAVQFTLKAWVLGRMTGGGSFFQDGVRITHGFELYCQQGPPAPVIGPNNLEVNWGGNHFHLDALTANSCALGPNPKPPAAPISIYNGSGTGTYNGQSGYLAYWQFIDAGEPGTNDIAWIVITDPTGTNTVLSAGPANLEFGNEQAHFVTGGKLSSIQ